MFSRELERWARAVESRLRSSDPSDVSLPPQKVLERATEELGRGPNEAVERYPRLVLVGCVTTASCDDYVERLLETLLGNWRALSSSAEVMTRLLLNGERVHEEMLIRAVVSMDLRDANFSSRFFASALACGGNRATTLPEKAIAGVDRCSAAMARPLERARKASLAPSCQRWLLQSGSGGTTTVHATEADVRFACRWSEQTESFLRNSCEVQPREEAGCTQIYEWLPDWAYVPVIEDTLLLEAMAGRCGQGKAHKAAHDLANKHEGRGFEERFTVAVGLVSMLRLTDAHCAELAREVLLKLCSECTNAFAGACTTLLEPRRTTELERTTLVGIVNGRIAQLLSGHVGQATREASRWCLQEDLAWRCGVLLGETRSASERMATVLSAVASACCLSGHADSDRIEAWATQNPDHVLRCVRWLAMSWDELSKGAKRALFRNDCPDKQALWRQVTELRRMEQGIDGNYFPSWSIQTDNEERRAKVRRLDGESQADRGSQAKSIQWLGIIVCGGRRIETPPPMEVTPLFAMRASREPELLGYLAASLSGAPSDESGSSPLPVTEFMSFARTVSSEGNHGLMEQAFRGTSAEFLGWPSSISRAVAALERQDFADGTNAFQLLLACIDAAAEEYDGPQEFARCARAVRNVVQLRNNAGNLLRRLMLSVLDASERASLSCCARAALALSDIISLLPTELQEVAAEPLLSFRASKWDAWLALLMTWSTEAGKRCFLPQNESLFEDSATIAVLKNFLYRPSDPSHTRAFTAGSVSALLCTLIDNELRHNQRASNIVADEVRKGLNSNDDSAQRIRIEMIWLASENIAQMTCDSLPVSVMTLVNARFAPHGLRHVHALAKKGFQGLQDAADALVVSPSGSFRSRAAHALFILQRHGADVSSCMSKAVRRAGAQIDSLPASVLHLLRSSGSLSSQHEVERFGWGIVHGVQRFGGEDMESECDEDRDALSPA